MSECSCRKLKSAGWGTRCAACRTTVDRKVTADADACLAYLIAHQDEWTPEMLDVTGGRDNWKQKPITLVAVPREAS